MNDIWVMSLVPTVQIILDHLVVDMCGKKHHHDPKSFIRCLRFWIGIKQTVTTAYFLEVIMWFVYVGVHPEFHEILLGSYYQVN